jgi:metal-responsive CopG/Arc/MetJ family transcriptional regulator
MNRESMKRLKIQLPQSLKAKLDALRVEGTTASGLIRRLLTEFFSRRATKERRK